MHLSEPMASGDFPNLFLLGAPKSGTTSLAEWLSGHPSIFVPKIKEPGLLAPSGPAPIADLEAYLRLYERATEDHGYRLDASTNYLYLFDEVAPYLLEYAKDPYFIVCLRHPVNMAISLHNHMVRSLNEDQTDLRTAWLLQEARARGERIPGTCRHPVLLQYGPYCRTGSQVENLSRWVSLDRVFFIKTGDLQHRPERAWRALTAWLGVSTDVPREFRKKNAATRNRSAALKALVLYLGKLKRRLKLERNFGVASSIERINSVSHSHPPLDPAFEQELYEYFRDDIATLKRLTGIDLNGAA